MKLLTMKMQVEEWERWKRQAEAECLSLAAWIRERCNADNKKQAVAVQESVKAKPENGGGDVVASGPAQGGEGVEKVAAGYEAEVGDEAGGTEEAVGVGGPAGLGRGGGVAGGSGGGAQVARPKHSRSRVSAKSDARKSEKKSGECGAAVAPGVYCPKCGRRH